jgi:8-oxo-dGTP pyrophosphatase MutT (NUDIX family)
MRDGKPDKLSCGAVLVRVTDEGWQALMLRAYRNWDFPKGLCEDGETPLEAAMREVGEETGITDLQFDWGDRYIESGPYNQGKIEEVEMGISPELGRPEHHEYQWMDFDRAYDLSSPRVRLVVQWARQVIGT